MNRPVISIEAENIRPLKKRIYVRCEDERKVKHGTLEIWVDPIFNPFSDQNAIQDGIVVHSGSDDINVGDRVYTHHFLKEPENRIEINGETLYVCEYFNVYGVERDGELTMRGEWNFLEPIEEPESNYKTESGIFTKPVVEDEKGVARARYINDELREQGVKEGDKVKLIKDSVYVMRVREEPYYRVKNDHIVAVFEEEKRTDVSYNLKGFERGEGMTVKTTIG